LARSAGFGVACVPAATISTSLLLSVPKLFTRRKIMSSRSRTCLVLSASTVAATLLIVAASTLPAEAGVQTYSGRVLADGAIRYYRLGDSSGDPAVDLTGTADGTYDSFDAGDYGQPGALVDDADPSAFFDGSNNKVTVPHAEDLWLTDDFAVEFWMYKTSEAGDWQRLVGKGSQSVRTFGVWEQAGASKKLLFQQYNGSNSNALNFASASDIPLNQWTHVVATVENNVGRIYIDGVLDAQGNRTQAVGTDTAPMTIGYAGHHTYYPGRLDEVAIYNRALSGGAVRHHYNLGLGYDYHQIVANDGATALYTFEDPSSADGATAADSIGTNDATYHGTVSQGSRPIDPTGIAAEFNGTSDYVSLPEALFSGYPTSGSTTDVYTLTFETWFSTEESGTILGQTKAGGTPGGANPGGYVNAVYIDADGHVRSTMFYHGSSGYQIVSADAYNDGNWHHLVNVFDDGTEALYLDGELIGTQDRSQVGYASNYDYYLGTGFTMGWPNPGPTVNNWHFFDGLLDDVAIYRTALDADTIMSHYLAGPVPEPGTLLLALLGAATLLPVRRRRVG
jgi:hypothetical protein